MSNPRNPFEGFRLEIDPEQVDEAIRNFREQLDEARERVGSAVDNGRYTKVRVSYKGQQFGPDIPLSAFIAGQGVALLALQPLWVLLGNLGAKAVLDVQFIHESDELITKGNDAYLHGEVDEAERCYREALSRREDDPSALYHLGVLLRVTGRHDEAEDCLRKAASGPEGHPDVVRASETLSRLKGNRRL